MSDKNRKQCKTRHGEAGAKYRCTGTAGPSGYCNSCAHRIIDIRVEPDKPSFRETGMQQFVRKLTWGKKRLVYAGHCIMLAHLDEWYWEVYGVTATELARLKKAGKGNSVACSIMVDEGRCGTSLECAQEIARRMVKVTDSGRVLGIEGEDDA